jgi:hypothetical protein
VRERAVSTSVLPLLFDILRCTPSLGCAHIAAFPKYQCNGPCSTPFRAAGGAKTRAGARVLHREEGEHGAGALRDGR